MRLNEDIILQFIDLQISINQVIKDLKITKKYLCNGVEMPVRTFNYKVKNKTFTGEELLRIAKFINRLP